MPYIDKTSRLKIELCGENINCITALADAIEFEGELNYVITRLCLECLKRRGEKYSNYNSIIGVLECAKQEFYRRQVAEYENQKITENGDID